jgi:D-glycero-D-manno-heptose 1,7-bisphosphate phosphatase
MLTQLKEYTLFLDRDGVINYELPGTYVLSVQAFKFYDKVPEAIAILNNYFKRVVVATNQKCVGKGLITHAGLHAIHAHMCAGVEQAGGRIQAVYYCADMENESPNRKPNPGMAYQCQQQFTDTDLSKSIMVGNNLSDMQFGKNAGMRTVFLTTTRDLPENSPELIDFYFANLYEFAQKLNLLFL